MLQNPSLESASHGVPTCWRLGGYGSNSYTWTHTTDRHSGTYAEKLQLTGVTSGDRKLLPTFDTGPCAPAATPGAAYTAGAWYKIPAAATGNPKFFAYYRSSSGSWNYWTESSKFAGTSTWTHATWTTPTLPAGATNISVGMGLTSAGSVTMDDYSLAQTDKTAPSGPGNVSAAPGDHQVALSWGASTDPDSPVTGYYVFRNGLRVAQVAGTTHTDGGLTNGTTYSYYVKAFDRSGNVSSASSLVSATPNASTSSCPNPGPQKTWAAPGTPSLSDAHAAACVGHQPETRPANVASNNYVPTDAQLHAFHSATDDTGSPADSNIPERAQVTGRPGLTNPSTDDLIQWAAHKWGIPEDWIRAQIAVESWWSQSSLGDRATVPKSWYSLYPPQARIAATGDVYETMGISQIKWRPDGSVDAGTEPLRWESSAFALDYYGAEIRYFYSGDCQWCGSGYRPGQQWPSIGAWYEPLPWGNSSARSYITKVQSDLQQRVWVKPGF